MSTRIENKLEGVRIKLNIGLKALSVDLRSKDEATERSALTNGNNGFKRLPRGDAAKYDAYNRHKDRCLAMNTCTAITMDCDMIMLTGSL